ncbi:MAG TPA: iron uptake transporter permease EfeU [Candidatus Nanopelagicales bacterium]|nr:iron uptake transporter permease EfeU [Candidatus Nanopelagicales bacterium]
MFDIGAFTSGLLTGLREGVEAALIVAIICAYLARTGNARHFGKISVGVGSAVATSLALGVVIFLTVGGLEEPYEQIFEGAMMLAAAGVVTWMLFWMRRQASSVKGDLQRAVDRVLADGTAWGLAVLAFTAVIREGLETALFLVGQATAAASGTSGEAGALAVLVGAVVGLGIAVALGYGIYRGSRVLNLRTFFRWTGVFLIFIAAGLLSHAIHEFVEIGWITVGTSTAFDVSALLPHEEGIGLFLRAIFGYTSTPEWVTLVAWATYVAVVLTLYLRPMQPRPSASRPEPTEAAPAPGA